jgi:hypothetical protein
MSIRFSMGKVLAILLALFVQFAFAQAVWDGTADTTWYTSNKSATEFTITTAEELAGLANLVNGGVGNGTYNMENKTIKLGANIMLNDTTDWKDWENNPPANEWVPIGKGNYKVFNGNFDGGSYVISGIYIYHVLKDTIDIHLCECQGFFGEVHKGIIKNIGVTASYIEGGWPVGGLVGDIVEGKIRDSYFTGMVIGTSVVGGLVGSNMEGEIRNSYSAGTVIGTGYINGLLGLASYVGGLVGANASSSIISSYSSSTVTGQKVVGGLVGFNYRGSISNTYSTGNVTGEISGVGGLVGGNGLMGEISEIHSSSRSNIYNSYSIGNVEVVNYDLYDIGGFIGGTNRGSIEKCYFDMETSRMNFSGGLGSGGNVINDATGKTIAEMKQQSTFVNWSFIGDRNEAWGIDSKINCGYPYLLGIEYSEDEECPVVTPIRLPQIANGQIIVQATNNGIILENLPRNVKVEVYNLHGKRIYNSQFSTLNSQFIEIQTKGIYIIKAGTQTFRVAVGQK